jgi:cyclohexanecarboxyl-CoA dehydrogenase
MDFAFSDEQESIRDTARRFASERLAPHYRQRDKVGRLDRTLLKDMGALGLLGTELPEEFGGLGADFVTTGVVMEEIAYADLNLGYILILCSLNGQVLSQFAERELARSLTRDMCAGNIVCAGALTEPRGGSDLANMSFRAKRDGDGYILSGEKTSITMSTQADVALLWARTGKEEEGARGISTFYVPLELPGIERTEFDDVGARVVGRGSLFFDEVRVPAKNLIGEEGGGFRQVMNAFDYSRGLIGLQVLGAARASLDETWSYVGGREAFGKPIVSFQGVSHPLAECETYYEAARLLCYRTLWLRDSGRPHTKEAAMVKWWLPKICYDIVHQCLLLHGHYGYTKELPLEQRLRDILGLQIGDGTAQIQKTIVAREMAGRAAAPK